MPENRKTRRDDTEEDKQQLDSRGGQKRRLKTPAQIAAEQQKQEAIDRLKQERAEAKAAKKYYQQHQAEEDDDEDTGSWHTDSSEDDEFGDERNNEDDDEVFVDDDDDIEEEIIDDEEAEEEEEAAAAVSGTKPIRTVHFDEKAAPLLNDEGGDEAAATVYRGGAPLGEGQQLEYSNQAYDSFFQLRLEYPCLSFDIVRDNDGEVRVKYPLSMLLVCGTQAEQTNQNELLLLRVTNICKTKYDLADDESEDSLIGDNEGSDDDDENMEEINGGEPIVDSRSIPHHGTVNRVRCCPGKPSLIAAWSDSGRVQVFDADSELRSMVDYANWTKEQALSYNKPKASALRFASSGSTHKTEGYGLDWSTVQTQTFASGDCNGDLFVWKPTEAGRWAPFSSGNARSSIEEIKWSTIQPDYLVTALAGGRMQVWDSRDLTRPKLEWQADPSDINVCDWNKARQASHLLVTGAEEGAVAVWDLRKVQQEKQNAAPIQTLNYHNGKKITSVEFSQHNESVVAVCSDDGMCTLWDLSLERDPDEERQVLGDLFGREDMTGIPDQLMFQHQGLVHPKELHMHSQIPGLVVTTDFLGLHLFKPMNWRSLMK